MKYGDIRIGSPPYFYINFQEGPVRDSGTNGCQTEDIIDVLVAELKRVNVGELANAETTMAIECLWDAKNLLNKRTHDRMVRNVEGTRLP